MANKPVDDFIQRKVLPEYRPIVAVLRQVMREYAPKAQEMISYGILAWKTQRIIAVVSPNKKGITFAFSRGGQFEDKYDLLRGVGKRSKHIKIKDLQDIKKPQLRYYIKQALEWDKK